VVVCRRVSRSLAGRLGRRAPTRSRFEPGYLVPCYPHLNMGSCSPADGAPDRRDARDGAAPGIRPGRAPLGRAGHSAGPGTTRPGQAPLGRAGHSAGPGTTRPGRAPLGRAGHSAGPGTTRPGSTPGSPLGFTPCPISNPRSGRPPRLLYFEPPKVLSHGLQRQQCQGGHVAPGRRAVRPVRRATTFTPRGVAAPTEGQSTQVPGQPAEGFLVSRGSCVGFRRGENEAALRLPWREN
jgi:hypothetical protein